MKICLLSLVFLFSTAAVLPAKTNKPALRGRHWIAIAGKPLAATAGAKVFDRGGNAVDAACAMLAAVCTMYDDLSWGGETQALLYDPRSQKVHGINALGVAPAEATSEFFLQKGSHYPPGNGPQAAVTPGTPGGLMVMLAEFGTLSLAQVLEPAMELAAGYPLEAAIADRIEEDKAILKQWPWSKKIFLPHLGRKEREAPYPGEIFRQADLLRTIQRLVEAEAKAKAAGKSRKAAILAAYDRFYRGDIAREFVLGSRAQGGLHTPQDLASWKVHVETPASVSYKGVEVYKLTCWTQGPALLQMLNILENFDLAALGYNSARYIHTLYQAMNLAFADRDFYYGDPYHPPEEPIDGLLSKEYAKDRSSSIQWKKNNPAILPGDPYPYEGRVNPYQDIIDNWHQTAKNLPSAPSPESAARYRQSFLAGTTTIQAADANGWVVSMTPSGGWLPACIAGKTGIGMSQRMQSFVLRKEENPFNVLAPGKRPRVTLTPSIALKNGKPFLAFGVQGGDAQDQNLLQFFLNVVEFGMNVQEACEAPNFNSKQLRSSFGGHQTDPGRLILQEDTPNWMQKELIGMGYRLGYERKTSGPITAIQFNQKLGTFQGGASDHGDDYGVVW